MHLYAVGDRGSDALHLLPTFVSGPDGELRPNPEASRLDQSGSRGAAAAGAAARAAVHAVARGGRRPARRRAHAAGDRVRVQPRRVRRRRRAVRRVGPAPHHERGGPRDPTDRRGPHRGARRRRSRRARLRRVARGPARRLRRAPRRHGPADEGGGRGGVHGRPGQGGVRDRDAVARHQHAGAHGRDREALEVHGRAPRVPDARGVHAARGAGGAARASTRSGSWSCSGTRSSPSTRSPGSRAAARTR